MKAPNPRAEDFFGISVAISGDTIVIGAHLEDGGGTGVNPGQGNLPRAISGAAYIFVRTSITWSQQAYLKASNTEANDSFGRSVGVSGESAIVGAFGEDSNATGVNGDQANNGASSAGAAYVFVRQGANWTQQAYLKASNTGPEDWFGRRVAISGETVAVAAEGEASSATGVEGDQASNDASLAGAAYIFARSGTSWTQHAYLKASNSDAMDVFGHAVAIDGGTVVVGANGEDSKATGVNGDQTDDTASNAGAAYVFTISGQLLNISTRLRVQTGDGVLIGGFIITGSDPKKVVIRGLGPSLSSFFRGVLANPTLELFQGNTLLDLNDDWIERRAEIEATGIPPRDDFESTIVRTLPPGAYTAVLRGKDNGTGIGIVEVYDLDQAANSQLANIATRGHVDTGDNVMIGRLILGGAGINKIVARALGPSLAPFGVPNPLANPNLAIYDSNGRLLRFNDIGGRIRKSKFRRAV